MLAITVGFTLIGGLVPGLLSALTSTLALWYFTFPPGLSFRAEEAFDIVGVLAAGAVACGLVVVVNSIVGRQQRALEAQTRLSWDLLAQGRTIATMQLALLQDVTPATSGVKLGWYYAPGGAEAAPVGGDWLTFVPVSPTRLGVGVGDVAGHGLSAVTAMAEYRYALRTLAADGSDPPAVLKALDGVSRLFEVPSFSTCVYGLIDVNNADFTYSSAGHPPPLLVRDGCAHVLAAPHGPPVGTGLVVKAFTSATMVLHHDDLLAFYTDGLVERRGENIQTGIDRLADRLTGITAGHDLSETCTEVVTDLVGENAYDDVALVLLRYANVADSGPAAPK